MPSQDRSLMTFRSYRKPSRHANVFQRKARFEQLENRQLLAVDCLSGCAFVEPVFDVSVTSDIVYRDDAAVGYGTPEGLSVRDLELDLYQPTGEGLPDQLPAIVIIHGGGMVVGDKADLAGLANDFASRGYVAVSINYRLVSDAAPPAPANPPLDEDPLYDTRVAAIADTFHAIEWLKNSATDLDIDPDRVLIGGSSAGSFLSSFSAMLDQPDIDGLTNESVDVTNLGVAGLLAVNGGSGGGAVNPFVDAEDPPTFIAHAQDDPVVDISTSVAFADALSGAGVAYEFPVVANGGHSWADTLAQDIDGQSVLDHAFDFFYDQLNLTELADAKYEQYFALNGNALKVTGTQAADVINVLTVSNGATVRAELQIESGTSLRYQTAAANVGRVVVVAGNGNDNVTINWSTPVGASIYGGGGNDHITGGAHADTIRDLYGDNTVISRSGNDTIVTGSGNDTIDSGGGDDEIDAGDGDNVVSAGGGNDHVATGEGQDTIDAAAGHDIVRSGPGNDTINGGYGNDILVGQAGADLIFGGGGRDLLIGGLGIDELYGGDGSDLLVGDATIHDASDIALQALMAEWSANRWLAVRQSNLIDGSGSAPALNGGFFLDATTIVDDNETDLLDGGLHNDWELESAL